MRRSVRSALFAVAAIAVTIGMDACRPHLVTMEVASDDPHAFSAEERRVIQEIAEHAFPEVRRALPDLPSTLVLKVRSGTDVIPETGENGSTGQPNVMYWEVDASHAGGVAAVARAQLRVTMFHELHHLVRGAVIWPTRLRDRVVSEGLATAFERDFAGASPPWGQYPPEVDGWADEVLALSDDTPPAPWLFRHPDGRRWVGIRVGTYLVERAMKASGRTSADLARVPTDEIVQMARAR